MINLDRCNGFLTALALVNCEPCDVYADFGVAALPAAASMTESLSQYFVRQFRDWPSLPHADRTEWHVTLNDITERRAKRLAAIADRWFFLSDHMAAAPLGTHRGNLVSRFIDIIEEQFDDFVAYEVNTSPPVWYAMFWSDIAFERGGERYLLHFSHSD